MKKLLDMYKSLPREMKMLIAIAGLGTPIGVIYFLRAQLGLSTMMIIVLGVALVAVIGLIAFVVPWLFGSSRRKRRQRMEADLVGGAESGPMSMDHRAAIKTNNDKLFTAIKKLREKRISVYDLPWYMVIGAPSCGKTVLVNKAGLEFPLGKPEGYQLGTLNYNWWFTEEAIFLDMAGRLCDPREDSDYREWQGFLKTIGAGRTGFPVNGVICCVSAEHLLMDPPERQEQDATTMLTRLRDLQNQLGVTFATYLVVTKCDLIPGFMQFFGQAETDIRFRNQIFGWSRPGSIEEPFDPEQFGGAFDQVYERLLEWRLRRLHDADLKDSDLGMAYRFPEEFRELRDPLLTYARTLFPRIKNPRVIKNLLFRGFYLTSATQEGQLILKHLRERDPDAARHFPPLETLFPDKRPHFVKDLLLDKVFPEEGLVFRNEKEVARSRKLARVLTVSMVALAVVMTALLGVSAWQFKKIIGGPRVDAKAAPEAALKDDDAQALALIPKLASHATSLRASVWPNLLSLGVGAGRPVEDLTEIHLRLFEESALQLRLETVAEGLRDGKIVLDGADGGIELSHYVDSLAGYLTWYECGSDGGAGEKVGNESFTQLSALTADLALEDAEQARQKEIDGCAPEYFAAIAQRDWPNPAARLRALQPDAAQTIETAVTRLHEFLQRTYVQLSAQHPDPTIAEWMRIADQCRTIQNRYGDLLAAGEQEIETLEDLEQFRRRFADSFAELDKANQACRWRPGLPAGATRLPRLREALMSVRDRLRRMVATLDGACAQCAGTEGASASRRLVAGLLQGGAAQRPGLDELLWSQLRSAQLTQREYFAGCYEPEEFARCVREVFEQYHHILQLRDIAETGSVESLAVTGDVQAVVGLLAGIRDTLGTLASDSDELPSLQQWLSGYKSIREGWQATRQQEIPSFEDPQAWERERLTALNESYLSLVQRGRVTSYLLGIKRRLDQNVNEEWGAAQLAAKWREPLPSMYNIPIPLGEAPALAAHEPSAAAPPEDDDLPSLPDLPAQQTAPPTELPVPVAPANTAGAPARIPLCATPAFLVARADECASLLFVFEAFKRGMYFARAGSQPLNEECADLLRSCWQQYCEKYAREWRTAYGEIELTDLQRLLDRSNNWQEFAGQFGAGGDSQGLTVRKARDDALDALGTLLRATRWALHERRGAPGNHYPAVIATYQRALSEQFGPGGFAAKGAASARANEPWTEMTDRLGQEWDRWCREIEKTASLRRDFETRRAVQLPEIDWEGVERIRSEYALEDETRIAAVLGSFQDQARGLLNRELTTLYCDLQQKHLEPWTPAEVQAGWPYLQGETAGGSLKTVELGRFVDFLEEAGRATLLFEPLERGFQAGDATAEARRVFARACQEWRDFLRLQSGNPSALEVRVKSAPFSLKAYPEVQDTAQNYYRTLCLEIGLASNDSRDLCFDTTPIESGMQLDTKWNWTTPREMRWRLVDGLRSAEDPNFMYPNVDGGVLGDPSPLALCALLQSRGRPDEAGTWTLVFWTDLRERLAEIGRSDARGFVNEQHSRVGAALSFDLGRKMPRPIQPLQPAGD